MDERRQAVFLTAKDYFQAGARYWHAAKNGQDMETPTQELVGRSIFYREALRRYAEGAFGADELFARRRLDYLRSQIRFTSDRYASERRFKDLLRTLQSEVDALAGERQKYLDVFRYVPEPCLFTTRGGMICDANVAAMEDLGMRPRRPIALYIVETERRAFRQNLYRAAGEWESVLKDGKRARFSVRRSARDELHWRVRAA